jgi:hypothetical protein
MFPGKKRSLPPVPAVPADQELESIARAIAGLPVSHDPTHPAMLGDGGQVQDPVPASPANDPDPDWRSTPFRVVKPSLPTLEKAMSIALFFEQYYHALLKPPPVRAAKPAHPGNYVLNRARRLAQLEASFHLPENRFMSEGEKDSRREDLIREENRMLRERRKKVDAKAFELGRVIGHGAFGVVRIARERQSGRLVAVKELRKAE